MAELVWFETDEELQSAAELVLKILNVTELRVTTGWVDYHEDILGQCNYHLPYATCKVRLKPNGSMYLTNHAGPDKRRLFFGWCGMTRIATRPPECCEHPGRPSKKLLLAVATLAGLGEG